MIQRSIVTLTNAQIKALPTTPITLISAPGVGFYIRPLAASWSYTFATAAYTNINTTFSELHLQINNGNTVSVFANDNTTTPVLSLLSAFLGASVSKVFINEPYLESYQVPAVAGFPLWVMGGLYNRSDLDNKSLTVGIDNNGSGNLTGGNASSTLQITIYYVIEPLP